MSRAISPFQHFVVSQVRSKAKIDTLLALCYWTWRSVWDGANFVASTYARLYGQCRFWSPSTGWRRIKARGVNQRVEETSMINKLYHRAQYYCAETLGWEQAETDRVVNPVLKVIEEWSKPLNYFMRYEDNQQLVKSGLNDYRLS